MKYTPALLSIFAFATAATAQRSYIKSPAGNTTVHKGQQVTLQLVRPNSIQGSREVGITLSFQSCPDAPCPPETQQLGDVLFIGQYNPQLHEIPANPYENFTLTIPNDDFLQYGKAELISTRFHLIGAGPSPVLETNVVQIDVAPQEY